MAYLVDTNILVYRFDPRFPEKQTTATDLLRRGLAEDAVRIPHQALLEFVAVVTRRPRAGSKPLLAADEARHETEELMVSIPGALSKCGGGANSASRCRCLPAFMVRTPHLWAYAEHYGLEEIVSEDFEHGRLYGSVRVRNPFRRGA